MKHYSTSHWEHTVHFPDYVVQWSFRWATAVVSCEHRPSASNHKTYKQRTSLDKISGKVHHYFLDQWKEFVSGKCWLRTSTLPKNMNQSSNPWNYQFVCTACPRQIHKPACRTQIITNYTQQQSCTAWTALKSNDKFWILLLINSHLIFLRHSEMSE